MKWDLVITSPASRDLRKVPRKDLQHVDAAMEQMCANPYSGDIKYLRGEDGALRRRVGVWRIFFELKDEHHRVVILAVKRRGSNTY
jgi:mRNA-degrading endonuclease RelE of RelBE toxin-antitoxin system